MTTAPDIALPPAGTKLRSPVPFLVMAAVGLGLVLQGLVLHVAFPAAIGTVLAAENALFAWRFGVTPTEHEVLVDGLRRRRIPWSEVQGISTEQRAGTSRLVIWTPTRKVALSAPVTFLGIASSRFEDQLRTLGELWLAHRGPDWQPVPWQGGRVRARRAWR